MKKFLTAICWVAGIAIIFVGAAYVITKLVDRFGKIYVNPDGADELPF